MLIRGGIRGGKLLSSRIKILWFIEALPVIFGCILLLFLFFFVLLPSFGFHDAHSVIVLIVGSLVLFILALLFVELRYRTWVYALDEEELVIKRGILEKIRYLVPYEKIQDVTVSRSPLEVFIGIGTIHIETAATAKDHSEFLLPGIADYHDVANALIEHSQKAQVRAVSDQSHHEEMVKELKTVSETLDRISELLKDQKQRQAKVRKQNGNAHGGFSPLTEDKKGEKNET